jgi:hypothetical protein
MHAPAMAFVLTVIVRTGPGGCTVPGSPGSLTVGVSSEGRGVKVDWPGAGAIGDKTEKSAASATTFEEKETILSVASSSVLQT